MKSVEHQPRPTTLLAVLAGVEAMRDEDGLFLRDSTWTLETVVIVAPLAAESIIVDGCEYSFVLRIQDVKQVCSHERQIAAGPAPERLLASLIYYIKNDAFRNDPG